MNAAYSAFGQNGNGNLGGNMLSDFQGPSGSLRAAQMGTSAIGMFSAMAAGKDQAMAYGNAAADATIEAQGARVQGAGQVAGLRTQLMQTLGQRSVQAGAGGVDVGQGAAAAQRATLASRVATQSGVDIAGANINAAKYQINALNDRMMAEQAKMAGMAGALGAGAGLGLGLLML
jgi:hypothetical protein